MESSERTRASEPELACVYGMGSRHVGVFLGGVSSSVLGFCIHLSLAGVSGFECLALHVETAMAHVHAVAPFLN